MSLSELCPEERDDCLAEAHVESKNGTSLSKTLANGCLLEVIESPAVTERRL
jgi:hypothetical protein